MQRNYTIALAILITFALAGAAAANDQLIEQLKTLGKAVDDMSANISKAESDADADVLAKATQQALDNGLKDYRAKVELKSSAGFCRATIETTGWKLWSESRGGKVVDHGATIN